MNEHDPSDASKSSRFQPGKSGNPRGRPKKTSSGYSILEEAFLAEVTVKVGGKKKKVPYVQAMIMNLQAQAAKGSMKAMEQLLRYCPEDILKGRMMTEDEAAFQNSFERVYSKMGESALMEFRAALTAVSEENSSQGGRGLTLVRKS